MEKKILPYLILISALSVTASAAYYSVTGLGKMFAGNETEIQIMGTCLEVAKVIVASLLYQYWDRINNWVKGYFMAAMVVLMVITSGGIYGYLSSSYSVTSVKLEQIDKQVSFIESKEDRYNLQLNDVQAEKQSLQETIIELSKGLSNNIIQYKDKEGNIITTTSSKTRRVLEGQLNDNKEQRDLLSEREQILLDSINTFALAKLELESNTDIASEVGPLKYIAKLTGKTMDQVVNWFMIALILVFDPLAIALIIAANTAFGGIVGKEPEEKVTPIEIFEAPKKPIKTPDEVLKNTNTEFKKQINSGESYKDEPSALANSQYRLTESIIQDVTTPQTFNIIEDVKEVKELIAYLSQIKEVSIFKQNHGYKIPLSELYNIGFQRQQIANIQQETKPFEGRLIIEEDVCIIEFIK